MKDRMREAIIDHAKYAECQDLLQRYSMSVFRSPR